MQAYNLLVTREDPNTYRLGAKMFTNDIVVKILVGIVFGLFLGLVTIFLSKKLTLNRTEDPVKAAPIDTPLFKVMSFVVGVGVSVAVVFTAGDTAMVIRNLALLVPIASISVVDSLVRKIPNSLLLSMIVIQAIYLAYYSVSNHTTQLLIAAGFGFFIGFAACTLPGVLKIPVGAGDIKYSGVIGLCIFFAGYLQAMVLMGLIAVGCLIVLKATKKGGLKTMIPMGPLISAGTVITMCYPILESFIGKNFAF